MTAIFANVRLIKIIVIGIIVLLLVPLLIHHYLTLVGNDSSSLNSLEDGGGGGGGGGGSATNEGMSSFIIQLTNIDKLEGQDLKYRIEELYRIKQSVGLELHSLEAKRRQIQLDITQFTKKLDEYKVEASHKKNELDRLQISVEQAKVAEKEAMERNTPRLGRPKSLGQLRYREFLSPPPMISSSSSSSSNSFCTMDSCFDYSLCPISNPFTFFAYQPSSQFYSSSPNVSLENNNSIYGSGGGEVAGQLHEKLEQNIYFSSNPYKSCVFIVVLDDCSLTAFKSLKTLLYWNGDGRNHLIWLTCPLMDLAAAEMLYQQLGRAMLLVQEPSPVLYRPNFDLITSHLSSSSGERMNLGADSLQLPSITPAKRKYLATYLGSPTDPTLQTELLRIQQEDPVSFVFQFSCTSSSAAVGGAEAATDTEQDDQPGAYSNKNDANKKLSDLCNNDLLRTRLLIDSTFSLIILPTATKISTTSSKYPPSGASEQLQLRLFESLKYGAIPILLGTNHGAQLPYSEVIDWSRLTISVPWARITELHYLLKYVADPDLLSFRKQGRLVYEKYLSSIPAVVDTVLGVIRTRVGLPPTPYKDVRWRSVFNDSFTPLKLESITLDPEDEENLGPIEPSYPSTTFTRNFTNSNLERYNVWNVHLNPFYLFPHSPWDVTSLMPSEAKFHGSSVGFRPIGGGSGGAGKEFSESLGGNLPKEQFTIVMLTYERESVLLNSLARLYLLPYLNKVVVVWNSEKSPADDLKWPDIGVPIKIVKAPKNSLNNRFVPFDAIETEAILSIDDDAHLRHDEIVFGFRVWREHRDRIVGFPGRFHAWDLGHNNWLYNSNYSCELSMVLTGAAFHHKIYSYLYTYEMPSIIRDKVDELMNCEDIAMNFLVSHLTQKPPVKVTSRWTFRCPGCPVTLSEDDSHFQERHQCINFFSQVYGYTPLLYTQFRADSILFKTRIPHDKQKCFKYI